MTSLRRDVNLVSIHEVVQTRPAFFSTVFFHVDSVCFPSSWHSHLWSKASRKVGVWNVDREGSMQSTRRRNCSCRLSGVNWDLVYPAVPKGQTSHGMTPTERGENPWTTMLRTRPGGCSGQRLGIVVAGFTLYCQTLISQFLPKTVKGPSF